MGSFSRKRRTTNIWPGFVDALATLLVVVLFLLMVFVLSQFFLSNALTGKNTELKELGYELNELTSMLSMQRKKNKDMEISINQLTSELQAASENIKVLTTARNERDRLQIELIQMTAKADYTASQVVKLRARLDEASRTIEINQKTIESKISEIALLNHDINALKNIKQKLEDDLSGKTNALEKEREISKAAHLHATLLSNQLEDLRQELAFLGAKLDASDALSKEQKAVISDLGKRLNRALASKVSELSKYSSEFFGRLRKVLGNRNDIKIDGDRFIFLSEVLFATASAELEDEGKEHLNRFADTLLEISDEIPSEIKWILRVDGHTDIVPINNEKFASNWELSAARAISVVKYLESRGISSNKMAAVGFGEYQPVNYGDTPEDLRQNRRIEFKLTQR